MSDNPKAIPGIEQKATQIAQFMDSNDLEAASKALYNEIDRLSPKDFRTLVNSTQAKEHKDQGVDLIFREEAGEPTAVVLSQKSPGESRERTIASMDAKANVHEWLPKEKKQEVEAFIESESKAVVDLLKAGDFDNASNRLWADWQRPGLGSKNFLSLANEIRKAQDTDSPAKIDVEDILTDKKYIFGAIVAGRTAGYNINLEMNDGAEHIKRTIVRVEGLQMTGIWAPPAKKH